MGGLFRPARVYMKTVWITLSVVLLGSDVEGVEVLYCPAGVKRRLPSGVKVSRRKNEVRVSL